MACFGLAVYSVLLIVGSALLNGWVIVKLWGWFIYPIFDVPILTVFQAIGIGLVIGLFTTRATAASNNSTKDKETTELIIEAFMQVVVPPLLFLLVGWIISGLV